jgi:hypothetical protein
LSGGCAVNKGYALADDFAEDWADVPDVAEVDTRGDNTLPFLGSARGTLVLEDGTSAERVAELAVELRDYLADRDNVTGGISADGVAFPVLSNEERMESILALWQSMATDARVIEGDIEMGYRDEDRWEVDAVAVDAAAALAVFEALVADGEPYRPLPWATSLSLTVWTDFDAPDSQRKLNVGTGEDGALPTAAIAAYEAVAGGYPIVEAFLSPTGAIIRMEEGTDLAAAEALARSAAPGLGDAVEVVVAR